VPLLIALFAGVTASASLASFALWQRRSSISSRRLRRVAAADVDPLAQSIMERALRPLALQGGMMLRRVMPPRLVAALDARLVTAGLSMRRQTFLGVWAVLALGLPALALLAGGFAGLSGARLTIWVVLAAVVGTYFPWYWLATRAKARTVDIDRSLPDVIDFIVTSVEAGVGMQGAMLNMARKFEGPLSQEFLQVVRETSLGRARDAALEAMAERCRSYDLTLLVSAIVQADQTGISIGRVLRNQADELRDRRRQRAREQAAKIPVKMTFPTVTLVFPTLFLLILGPVILRAIELFQNQ
jgi:tight adherence protein C